MQAFMLASRKFGLRLRCINIYIYTYIWYRFTVNPKYLSLLYPNFHFLYFFYWFPFSGVSHKDRAAAAHCEFRKFLNVLGGFNTQLITLCRSIKKIYLFIYSHIYIYIYIYINYYLYTVSIQYIVSRNSETITFTFYLIYIVNIIHTYIYLCDMLRAPAFFQISSLSLEASLKSRFVSVSSSVIWRPVQPSLTTHGAQRRPRW